jgi:hypothetical protein
MPAKSKYPLRNCCYRNITRDIRIHDEAARREFKSAIFFASNCMIHFNFPCTSFGLNNPRKYSAALEALLVVEREGATRSASKNLVLYRMSPA